MKLKLHNIQGHSNSVLEIKTGINAILGSSDSGKSTIVRALHWLVFNKPSADALKRTGASKMYVELTLEDGTVVRRERSKSKNLYVLNGEELKAFGTGVPAEVSSALNLSEFNFRSQYDEFFFLSSSGPERARILNRLLGMDKISASTKYVSNKIREEKSKLKTLQALKEEAEEEAKATSRKAAKAESILIEVEKAFVLSDEISETNGLIYDLEVINELKGELKTLNNEIDCLSDVLSDCDSLVVQVKAYKKAQRRFKAVREMKDELSKLESSIVLIASAISKLDLARCKSCGTILTEKK